MIRYTLNVTKVRCTWVVIALLLALNVTSTAAPATSKTTAPTGLTPVQRKQLTDAQRRVNTFPKDSKMAFICEQLGLCFKRDGSQGMRCDDGKPGTWNDAFFVNSSGRAANWGEAHGACDMEKWDRAYGAFAKVETEVALAPFKKDADKAARNTARYLLKTMPEELRWAILASMAKLVYGEDGVCLDDGTQQTMECGIPITIRPHERRNAFYVDPAGNTHKLSELYDKGEGRKWWRWEQVVWRCENLIGSKILLTPYSAEIDRMRSNCKGQAADAKKEFEVKLKGMLSEADDLLSPLPAEERQAFIAEAVGLYYKHPDEAGFNGTYQWLDPNVKIYLCDGKVTDGLKGTGDTRPARDFLHNIPHAALLEHFHEEVSLMATFMAKDRFESMPPLLRDALRAEFADQLTTHDGTPAVDGTTSIDIQAANHWVRIPRANVLKDKAYFVDSTGKEHPYSAIAKFDTPYKQTICLAYLCAHILGKNEILRLIPGSIPDMAPSADEKTGNNASVGAQTTGDEDSKKQLNRAVSAIKSLSGVQLRAWIAEKLGFCYSHSKATAYAQAHEANDQAFFVGADGQEHQLTKIADKDDAKWQDATAAAQSAGYPALAVALSDDMKAIATETSRFILSSMPAELRAAWLAENNRLFFHMDKSAAYHEKEVESRMDSGMSRTTARITDSNLFYFDKNGKITKSAAVDWNTWLTRWHILYYCANVAGMDAVNESFQTEVDAMRAAFDKSSYSLK